MFVYLHSETSKCEFRNKMVRWMSGLVTGLQNRLQRFESASDLRTKVRRTTDENQSFFFVCLVAVCKHPRPAKQTRELSALRRTSPAIAHLGHQGCGDRVESIARATPCAKDVSSRGRACRLDLRIRFGPWNESSKRSRLTRLLWRFCSSAKSSHTFSMLRFLGRRRPKISSCYNFIFKLYNIVLVLPNIEMNPPQVYLCSPS